MPYAPTIIARQTAPMRRSAFTLVELMVSIALALLLLVGINKVFKTTTDTVGTGYATSQVMRQQMAVDRTFDHTFASAVTPSQQPFILIHSQQQFAFMDRKDLSSDKDGDPSTADFAASGTESAVSPADVNSRSHRVDTLSFFARDINDPFHRTTGDSQTSTTTNTGLVSSEYSPEAYIWIGHLRLPNEDKTPPHVADNPDPAHANVGLSVPDSAATANGQYFDPGQASLSLNPNNFVVADWALGQETILLKPEPSADYIKTGAGALSPISKGSVATFNDLSSPDGHGKQWAIPNSRLDIANTSISDYRTQIVEKLGSITPTTSLTPSSLSSYPTKATESLDYRFNGKPWITKPANPSASNYMQILSRETALTSPFMFRGCSQFIVEFAGDFVTQQNDQTKPGYGTISAAKPDGVIDYYIDPQNVRHIRWYGFPRDVAGPVTSTNPSGGPDGQIDPTYDVVPVRDVLSAAGIGIPAPWFEKVLPSDSVQANYLSPTALSAGACYICAWGPEHLDSSKPDKYMPPQMIRIVMQLTDPQGRLGEGPVSEYVYKFGH